MVRIYEVTESQNKIPGGQTYLTPTGRQIFMSEDSPLFAHFGEDGKKAVVGGAMAVATELFQEVYAIVVAHGGADIMSDEQAVPAPVGGKKKHKKKKDAVAEAIADVPESSAIDNDDFRTSTYTPGTAAVDDEDTPVASSQPDGFSGFDGGMSGGAGATGDYDGDAAQQVGSADSDSSGGGDSVGPSSVDDDAAGSEGTGSDSGSSDDSFDSSSSDSGSSDSGSSSDSGGGDSGSGDGS